MEETTKAQGSTVYDPAAKTSPDTAAATGADAATVTEDRPRGPHNIQNHSTEFDASIRAAEHDAAVADRARFHGVSLSLMDSGTAVHDMIQTVFNKESTAPADLRPIAAAFRRHCAAKEATVGRTLESRSSVAQAVRRDREEGVELLALLDRAIASPGLEGTRPLTVNGVLADIDQYLGHEQRDLVPLIERELPVSQSDRLATAFRA
ncbi:hypothetical protein [Actinacidiphila alni]|uniref:hypothetical protein n=1 Tax=Actinacidiphila alni TaxID=380248 RepID=UPI003452531A